MDAEKVPVIIIGAGVVGCAVAEALSRRAGAHGRPAEASTSSVPCASKADAAAGSHIAPWVLEAGPRIAEGTTSRNSGVIHSGIYYPPKSLKAQTCIRGQKLLYEWCGQRRVPHKKTGKWIVGSGEDDEQTLAATLANAQASGASGLRWVTRQELQQSLPGIKAHVAIDSPNTGIVDPYAFSRSLLDAACARGAEVLVDTKVLGITRLASRFSDYLIETTRGPIRTEYVINAAGLHADEIARMAGIDKYTVYPWRGDYFRLSPRFKFQQLIYPTKKKGAAGLGVHLTISLDGTCKLGPDVEFWPSKTDFDDHAASKMAAKTQAFFEAASKYIEGLRLEDLSYDTCGIRPKLRAPTDKDEVDFVISEDLPGFVNLVGIESPGLTAAMAIAEKVRRIIQ